jgi:hypothetical protein
MYRYGLPFIIMTTMTLIVFQLVQDVVVYPISDTLFISGQLFFFYGLIRITNATEIFAGFRYSYRRMFGRRQGESMPKSFFEVQERLREKREERDLKGTSGSMYFFGSIAMLLVSLNITF